MPARDDFTPDVIRRLGEAVNLHCSNCDAPTKGGHSAEDKAVSVGVACHINGAASGGPRYDSSQSAEERRSFDNGIWLCANCARLIDADVARFTAEVLRTVKRGAIRLAAERLGRPPTPIAAAPTVSTAAAGERGAMSALAIHLEVLREQAYEANVSGSWRIATPRYDVSRIDDLLPSLPTMTADPTCCEWMKMIHYWAQRPDEPPAARMIQSESERLLRWLRSRLAQSAAAAQ
jgi:hypothetical protein